MATTTWALSKDTTTAGGAVDLGNGADQHAPVGYWSGYVYRHFAQYAVSTSGMSAISSAILHVRSSSQVHVGFGSRRSIDVARVSSSWSGSGGSEGSWSGSANPKDSTQPTANAPTISTTMTGSESTWDTIDITVIAQAWLAGSPNYGLRFKAGNEGNNSDTWEFGAQAGSFDSYITVTYTPTATAHPPTCSIISPQTGDVVDLLYTAGSGWASPRPQLAWDFNDVDGNTQKQYQVIVYSDVAGVQGASVFDSGVVAGADTSLIPAITLTEGSYYWWTIQVWDTTGLASGASAAQRFRARWGQAEYVRDLGATPNSWSVSTILTAGSVVIEYNSTTDAADPGAALGTWQASLASVTRRRFFRYRVWLLSFNAVAPTVDALTVSYNLAAVPVPDNWTLSADAAIDTATKVYGVHSLRIDSVGVDERTRQLVSVNANTDYYLHGMVKQSAVGVGGFIAIGTTPTGGELVRAGASTLYSDWTHVGVPWNSGSNTSVYVQVGANGTGTTWFDALKLEASVDPTLWLPSVLSAAVVLDGSGLKIDASQGASLRIRGASGTSRDEISVDNHGLLFGGDTTVYSVGASRLKTDGNIDIGGSEIRGVSAGSPWRITPNGAGKIQIDNTASGALTQLDILTGLLNLSGSLFIASTQVLSTRRTGWTAATGTAQRTTFASDTVTLINLARAVKALIDDLIAHGIIGT